MSEHRAARKRLSGQRIDIHRLGEESTHLQGVVGILGSGQLGIPKRSRVEQEEAGIQTVSSGAIQLRFAIGAGDPRSLVSHILERIEFGEGFQSIPIQLGLVDELTGGVEAGIRRHSRTAREIVDHLMVVNRGEEHRACPKVRHRRETSLIAEHFGVLATKLLQRADLGIGHRRRRHIGINGITQIDKEIEAAAGYVTNRRIRRQFTARIATHSEAEPDRGLGSRRSFEGSKGTVLKPIQNPIEVADTRIESRDRHLDRNLRLQIGDSTRKNQRIQRTVGRDSETKDTRHE